MPSWRKSRIIGRPRICIMVLAPLLMLGQVEEYVFSVDTLLDKSSDLMAVEDRLRPSSCQIEAVFGTFQEDIWSPWKPERLFQFHLSGWRTKVSPANEKLSILIPPVLVLFSRPPSPVVERMETCKVGPAANCMIRPLAPYTWGLPPL